MLRIYVEIDSCGELFVTLTKACMKEFSFQYSTKSRSSIIFDIENSTTMKKKETSLPKLTLTIYLK